MLRRCAWAAALATLSSSLSSPAAAHNRSEGALFLTIADDGAAALRIELNQLDLPELCDVDLSWSQAAVRAAEEEKLSRCVAARFPQWLHLDVDGQDCPVAEGSFHHGEGPLQIVLTSTARCPVPVAGHVVTLDWGLFASSSLDFVAKAEVQAGPIHKRALLSRRSNKLTVAVPRPAWLSTTAWAGLAALVLLATTTALWVRRHRRRQST